MTQFARTGLPPAAGDDPNLGHPSNHACDQEFVGRTSAPASGRALVSTTQSRYSEASATSHRPPAAFLSHLIATALQAPQTRVRRRAAPADASAVYAAATAGYADVGRTLRRSL
jgi:hypothetical protein